MSSSSVLGLLKTDLYGHATLQAHLTPGLALATNRYPAYREVDKSPAPYAPEFWLEPITVLETALQAQWRMQWRNKNEFFYRVYRLSA